MSGFTKTAVGTAAVAALTHATSDRTSPDMPAKIGSVSHAR
ncbi:hypothetical protein USDA257_c21110 [Sinorhizobium fredii USDA 257]|uniref:Uncharacterized protein n=1 Tax=Sinorhizobium fredii (strain USDA 257) TaxID=1185652 RepID=I3X487_SINF2|nr:hypothetical protein USDA257_c21110 [Sinorhizobium fredii USDA 257]